MSEADGSGIHCPAAELWLNRQKCARVRVLTAHDIPGIDPAEFWNDIDKAALKLDCAGINQD